MSSSLHRTGGPDLQASASAIVSAHEAIQPDQDEGESLAMPQDAPRFEWWLIIGIMTALTVLTLMNVVIRYLTSASFAYTEEVSVALMVALVMAGSACAVRRDQHIRVTFLIDRSPAARRVSDAATLLLTLITFGLMLYYGIRQTQDDIEFNVVSAGLGVPEWWFSIILPIGSALICVRTLQVIVSRRRPGAAAMVKEQGAS